MSNYMRRTPSCCSAPTTVRRRAKQNLTTLWRPLASFWRPFHVFLSQRRRIRIRCMSEKPLLKVCFKFRVGTIRIGCFFTVPRVVTAVLFTGTQHRVVKLTNAAGVPCSAALYNTLYQYSSRQKRGRWSTLQSAESYRLSFRWGRAGVQPRPQRFEFE